MGSIGPGPICGPKKCLKEFIIRDNLSRIGFVSQMQSGPVTSNSDQNSAFEQFESESKLKFDQIYTFGEKDSISSRLWSRVKMQF